MLAPERIYMPEGGDPTQAVEGEVLWIGKAGNRRYPPWQLRLTEPVSSRNIEHVRIGRRCGPDTIVQVCVAVGYLTGRNAESADELCVLMWRPECGCWQCWYRPLSSSFDEVKQQAFQDAARRRPLWQQLEGLDCPPRLLVVGEDDAPMRQFREFLLMMVPQDRLVVTVVQTAEEAASPAGEADALVVRRRIRASATEEPTSAASLKLLAGLCLTVPCVDWAADDPMADVSERLQWRVSRLWATDKATSAWGLLEQALNAAGLTWFSIE